MESSDIVDSKEDIQDKEGIPSNRHRREAAGGWPTLSDYNIQNNLPLISSFVSVVAGRF